MSLIKCPDCKRKISRSAINCPYCGHHFKTSLEIAQERKFKRDVKKERKIQKAQSAQSGNPGCVSYIIVGVIVFAIIGHFIPNDNDSKNNSEISETQTTNNFEAKVSPTDTPIPTTAPQPVAVEDSTILPALKLFDNYEEYDGQYVTISIPVASANGDVVEVDDDTAGKFYITLLEPRSDLTDSDFITVTGRVNGMSFGEVQLDYSNISATGSEPAQAFEQRKIDYSNESGKIVDENLLSEDEFKARCKEMYYEDITFSEKNLEGEYVKVKLYIEDSGVINPKKYYDSGVEELITKYHLDQTMSMVGIYSKDTNSYGSGSDVGILYSSDTGYTGTDFPAGTYITLYGKIINYAIDNWSGHNSAYFMPKYIES